MNISALRLNDRIYCKAEGKRLSWGLVRSIHPEFNAVRVELSNKSKAIVKGEHCFVDDPKAVELAKRRKDREDAKAAEQARALEEEMGWRVSVLEAKKIHRNNKEAAESLGISVQKFCAILRKIK